MKLSLSSEGPCVAGDFLKALAIILSPQGVIWQLLLLLHRVLTFLDQCLELRSTPLRLVQLALEALIDALMLTSFRLRFCDFLSLQLTTFIKIVVFFTAVFIIIVLLRNIVNKLQSIE